MHFGRLASKRTEFGGKGGPGPGDYEPYKDVQVKAENANIHDEEAAVRYEARIPRYNEAIIKETEKMVSIGRRCSDLFLFVWSFRLLVCLVVWLFSSHTHLLLSLIHI